VKRLLRRLPRRVEQHRPTLVGKERLGNFLLETLFHFGDILLGKLENEGERTWVADRYRIAIDGHAKRVRCGRVASPERD
ncbi:hypothetical protein MK139_09160, partial [bacterium]|nr:hypothetical protein [bacterium]